MFCFSKAREVVDDDSPIGHTAMMEYIDECERQPPTARRLRLSGWALPRLITRLRVLQQQGYALVDISCRPGWFWTKKYTLVLARPDK